MYICVYNILPLSITYHIMYIEPRLIFLFTSSL